MADYRVVIEIAPNVGGRCNVYLKDGDDLVHRITDVPAEQIKVWDHRPPPQKGR